MLPLTPTGHLFSGADLIILGEFLFASMGVGIRFVSAEVPNEVVVFFRNSFSVLLLTPWLLRGARPRFATVVPWLHLLRALAGVGAMYCFFFAIAHIPLAYGWLLWSEPLSWGTLIGSLMVLASGVILTRNPQTALPVDPAALDPDPIAPVPR